MNILKRLVLNFNNLISPKIVPPTYERKREIIQEFKNKFQLNILVETGTFLGDTIDYFKNIFGALYSVELSEELAGRAKDRFASYSHITIIQGDSGEVLEDLVRKFDTAVLFWLDGHYSSEFFLNGEYIVTAKGEKETPIQRELESILSSGIDHVILIDDARCFNGKGDYPKYETIKKIVNKRKPHYSIEKAEDIIRIYPGI